MVNAEGVIFVKMVRALLAKIVTPPTVENVEEVVLVQNVGVQVSAEVVPVDVEDIKAGSLLVLFFAYLSDK